MDGSSVGSGLVVDYPYASAKHVGKKFTIELRDRYRGQDVTYHMRETSYLASAVGFPKFYSTKGNLAAWVMKNIIYPQKPPRLTDIYQRVFNDLLQQGLCARCQW